MTLTATAIQNREHRTVAAQAIKSGWSLERTGNGHFQLQAVGSKGELHVVPISGTPAKAAPDRIRSHMLRCLAGKCGHGGHVEANDPAERRAAAAARVDRETMEALERAMRMPAAKPIPTGGTAVKAKDARGTKPRRKASRPNYDKAAKWAAWWMSSPAATAHMSGGKPIAQKRIVEAAKDAGHSWSLVGEALLAMGATCEYRGRNGSWWRMPDADAVIVDADGPTRISGPLRSCVDGGQAHTLPASPVSSGESVSVKASNLAIEWGRLEGMAEMLNPKLAEQVACVRRLVEDQ